MNARKHTSDGGMSRRGFLCRAGALAAGTAVATQSAEGRSRPTQGVNAGYDEDYDFLFARVKFHCHDRVADRWSRYPGAEKNLLYELSDAVRCKTKDLPDCRNGNPKLGEEYQFNAVVTLDDMPALRRYPFIFMTAEKAFPVSARERENLTEYLTAGGFLLADDCVWSQDGDYFFQYTCELLDDLFGAGSVRRIPADHEVMHNVYDMRDIGLPRYLGINRGPTGLFIGDRLAAFLSSTDLHCGWQTVKGRRPKPGRHSYAECVAMGVNICTYAMSH